MVNDFIQEFKNTNTKQAYKSNLKTFFEWYKEDLELIEYKTFESYIDYLIKNNYKAQSINLKLIAIKKYIQWLDEKEMIKNKTYKDIELLKINQKQWLDESITLKVSEYKRIVNQAEKANDLQAIAIFKTLYCTGCRVSELISIKGTEYKNGYYEIKRGKGNKSRTVFVNNEAIEAINEYRKQRGHDEEDYIFLNKTNKNHIPRQKVNEIMLRYAGKAKIKKTKAHPHALRHLLGFLLVENNTPIEQVSNILGHQNLNTTQIYTKVNKDELKLKVENILKKVL